MRNEETVQLSKWWKTPSAQAAMRRAQENKREKIAEMRKRIAERRLQLDREVAESQEVDL